MSRRALSGFVPLLLALAAPACASKATPADAEPDGAADADVADARSDADAVGDHDATDGDHDATDGDHDATDGDHDATDGDLDGDLDATDGDLDGDLDATDGDLDGDGPFVRLSLSGGGEATGELIATYDHSRWWDDPAELLTYALFTPAALAEYPDDRSVALVSSDDVVGLERSPLPPGVPAYRDVLRERRILLEALPLEGVAFVITANEGYHLEENGYGDFALDLVRTDDEGQRFLGDGAANEDYLVWDDEVYLPRAGVVVEVVRGGVDNSPGSYPEGAVNNMVGLQLFGAFYLYLLHFREGSIPAEVEVGRRLERGALLGRVGNAGVSLEPHLHLALLWYDEAAAAPRSWSVPVELAGLYLGGSPSGPSHYEEHASPMGGVWVSSEPF